MTRKYSHSDFVLRFGEGYREKCLQHFVSSGFITGNEEISWLDPNHPDYTHRGSDANYPFWKVVNNNLLIVSIIPSESGTSPAHFHPHNVIEKYTCLVGQCDLWLDGKSRRLETGETFDVRPGIKHRVTTNGSWVILAIVMENGGLYPSEQLHRR
mgnify:CR=1 FL=1